MEESRTPVIAPPITGRFTADRAHSSLQFTVKHMLVASFTAGFDDFDIQVEGTPAQVKIEGTVRADSLSIKFPPEFREHVLYGPDFFDAHHHPTLSFSSDDLRLSGDGSLELRGELTIKGISKPFTATGTYEPPIEDPYGNLRAAANLSAVVDRRDWDMGWQAALPKGGDVLGWQVTLDAHIELIKQA